jgi:acetoacetyl-CoA reductase
MAKRLALVTGGMGGLGETISTKMADAGYRVAVTCSPSNKTADQWCATMATRGYHFRAYACDVADFDSCRACVDSLTADLGAVDILINNAGITRDMTFRKMSKRDWDAVLHTNLDSVFNMSKQVCDGMVDRGWGRIINVSSVNGSKGAFGQTNYSAAKAGVHGFTKALALEVARDGVTVNTISPGYINRHRQGGARFEDSSADSAWASWGARRDRRPDHLSLLRGGGLRDRCKYRDQWRPAHAVTETLEAIRSLRRYQMKAANLNSDDMLKTMVVEAVKQQKQIRSTVRDPTLKALPARELGLSQIDNVVRNVGMAAELFEGVCTDLPPQKKKK